MSFIIGHYKQNKKNVKRGLHLKIICDTITKLWFKTAIGDDVGGY